MPILKKRRSNKAPAKKTKLNIQGWRTTDEDEIAIRRQRGELSAIKIENTEPEIAYFATVMTQSESGSKYTVEIRSLSQRINSCECPDYQGNQLGTCKHIEKVLFKLNKSGVRKFKAAEQQGSGRIEIYMDRTADNIIRVQWPHKMKTSSQAYMLVEPFFSEDGSLIKPIAELRRLINAAAGRVREKIRFSKHMDDVLDRQQKAIEMAGARNSFLADVDKGKRTLDLVKIPLYRYQQQGMLHLVFTQRALLADEMGLGKTVQAIAACELLRRTKGIKRVLVVATASLKTEWEEQIAKFTDHSSKIILGTRENRLQQYQEEAFFYLVNYEQVRNDVQDIQRLIAPDVVILDEAQRIKNWQTKTANAVKKLTSPYAFVLTGTPLENRIDDIYSIVQFLDPHLFGPLFRFNRDYYDLDEKGKAVGYKNLDELHQRLRPILLRRRKSDVEGQLPDRTVNHYFVNMEEEQQVRYDEYKVIVARIMLQAKSRPLRPEEMKRLQSSLACMRMLCDSTYILDQTCRVSPKIDELETILEELLQDQTTKIIIFSEWERMLQLVRALSQKMGIGAAWHTGSVAQQKRRVEINRFKEDPNCRLFLSTDSGSVGLNLQAANVVINLDLPWNPAKLEQRIARAWRKHQTRSVQVINLVTEGSIEHRMLSLLEQKQNLARGVIDGDEDIKEMALPSGRAAFMQRMDELLGDNTAQHECAENEVKATQPVQRLKQEIISQHADALDLLQIHENNTIVAVVNDENARQSIQKLNPSAKLQVLDRGQYALLQQLAEAGVITINSDQLEKIYESKVTTQSRSEHMQRCIAQAKKRMQEAERKQRMAALLLEGDFHQEALPPLQAAIDLAIKSFATLHGHSDTPISLGLLEDTLIKQHALPKQSLSLVALLRDESCNEAQKSQVKKWQVTAKEIIQHISEAINSKSLG